MYTGHRRTLAKVSNGILTLAKVSNDILIGLTDHGKIGVTKYYKLIVFKRDAYMKNVSVRVVLNF